MNEAGKELTKPISINIIIDTYLLKLVDISKCFRVGSIAVLKNQAKEMKKQLLILKKYSKKAQSGDRATQVDAIRNILPAIIESEKLRLQKPHETVAESLLIAIFNAFDVYTGELIRGLFNLKPTLFSGLNKQVEFSRLLESDSLEDIKNEILENEIESFRRKSYVDQFTHLEIMFGIETLTKFEDWPKFVEAGQRRNLLTHCGGVVSEQYLKICKAHKCKNAHKLKIGEKLEVDVDYFRECSKVMSDVGLMLGQTLWRKTAPQQISDASRHINHVVYEELRMEKYKDAEIHATFALTKMMQNEIPDVDNKIAHINLAIAYRELKKDSEADKLLNAIDFSGSLPEFKLAKAVLTKDYQSAIEIMKKIGKRGEILLEESYGLWPLFKLFRETELFLKTYAEIYGYEFSDKVKQEGKEQTRTSLPQVTALEIEINESGPVASS